MRKADQVSSSYELRSKRWKTTLRIFVICYLFFMILLTGIMVFRVPFLAWLYRDYRAATPAIDSRWGETTVSTFSADYYVSTQGNDDWDGSRERPFRTIEKAQSTIRTLSKEGREGIVVAVESGIYLVNGLRFDPQDGGTESCPILYRAYGGEVILQAGVTLSQNDFESVSNYPEAAARLSGRAKEKVIVIDLTKAPYGLTQEDWGKLYAVGIYSTERLYAEDASGHLPGELFVGGKRQSLARYPDDGYLETGDVLSDGRTESEKSGSPKPDVYLTSTALADRIASWQDLENVWAYGFWQYDWADSSSPIASFDQESGALSIAYRSYFGAREGAPYYFFNCLEELTVPGEWYSDRDRGLLYYYPTADFPTSEILFSTSTAAVLTVQADHVTFDGFTLKGGRSDGIVIYGKGVSIRNCCVTDVAGFGIRAEGRDILLSHNEITNVGRGGIALSGGDFESLNASGIVADNNLIHDWSEIYKTYQAGISLYGVGNRASHNELYNAPHYAITYSGNDNLVEYNLIHDVCSETDDAGAIYAGRSWRWYGNVIRYNCIYDLGAKGHSPSGIYLDDAMSGQSVYGNLLLNVPKYSLFIGGGRDNRITGNVIVNPGEAGIYYDARAREGVLGETWFSDHVREGTGALWSDLLSSPWQSEIWLEAYPQYRTLSADFSDPDDPYFAPNPAGTLLSGNIVFEKRGEIGMIHEAVSRFSEVKENYAFTLNRMKYYFVGSAKGEYAFKKGSKILRLLPDFEALPLSLIGRY